MYNPIRLSLSQLFAAGQQAGLEVQDQTLYSLVTLPAAINPSGGINFFGDSESAVGAQRTNLTEPNKVPSRLNYEIHGVAIKFTAAPTVLYTSINDAVRDAYMSIVVANSERKRYHLTEFLPTTYMAPSFSAAAGDNPVLAEQGISFYRPLALPIPLQGGVNFTVRVFFVTNVAALGSTVMGVYFGGLIDRGNVKLDQSPVRAM